MKIGYTYIVYNPGNYETRPNSFTDNQENLATHGHNWLVEKNALYEN